MKLTDDQWRAEFAAGETDRAIAKRLGIPYRRVEHHRRRLGVAKYKQPGTLTQGARTMMELEQRLRGKR